MRAGRVFGQVRGAKDHLDGRLCMHRSGGYEQGQRLEGSRILSSYSRFELGGGVEWMWSGKEFPL